MQGTKDLRWKAGSKAKNVDRQNSRAVDHHLQHGILDGQGDKNSEQGAPTLGGRRLLEGGPLHRSSDQS